MWYWNGGGAGWLLMALVMVAFWGAVIWGIVYLVRDRNEPRHRAHSDDDKPAIDLLEERFARGEIDNEEFWERRDALLRG